MKNEIRAIFPIRVSPFAMLPHGTYSYQKEKTHKLLPGDLQEKKMGIYGNLKFLSRKFSRSQHFWNVLTRLYEVCLNLDGSLEKETPSSEKVAERVGEVVFILDTLGVSDLKSKRIEGLCDKLLLKDDIAVSILVLLLELTSYQNIQERERESSLERFFQRNSHRRTRTLANEKTGSEVRLDLIREPRDLSKSHWKHSRNFSLQLDTVATRNDVSEPKDNVTPRSRHHRRNTGVSSNSSLKTAEEEFVMDEEQQLEPALSTRPKSIFDFSDKMYQAVYRKHFGSRSKSWIPPNHPLIFETARWSLISNTSSLIRRNPLGGFEPVSSKLQPCARKILGEFAAIATDFLELELMITRLQEKKNPILQGFAKALLDEFCRYSENILPVIRKTSYKTCLKDNINFPVFGLMQQVRPVTSELHECMVIMKTIMPYGELEPYQMLIGLYHYQKDLLVSEKGESLCGTLFSKVFISYLFALRRTALYGSQLSGDNDDNNVFLQSAASTVTVPKLLEKMLPMNVKFMVDKSAYGVDILWSINPQHPFFSSNRESLCTVPSFDCLDIGYLERQVEEYFANISKKIQQEGIPERPLHHHAFCLSTRLDECEDCVPRDDVSKKDDKEDASDDELSWLSSESCDSVHEESTAILSSSGLNKSNGDRTNLERNPSNSMSSGLWESTAPVKNEVAFMKRIALDLPFEKFVAELALVSIRGIYYHVQQYLWWAMEEKIEIFDQFRAVRDYLLLNRGDFFLELCNSVYNISSSEWFIGGTEAEARLQLAFDQAILSSSAVGDPRIRNFKFLMEKNGNMDSSAYVYNQILLQWKPSNLVESALFDSSTLEIYSHIFHFAFKLKSTSYILRQLYTSITSFPSHWQGLQRKAHILRFQLMQFVNALLQFYEHGLLEGNWFRFLRDAKKCNDVWQLRNLHLQFLDETLSYIFRNDNPLAADLSKILEEIIVFDLDASKAVRKPNVSNISMLGRRIEVLSSMLNQFYDKILSYDKAMKVQSTEWTKLMTYFGMSGE